MTKESGFELKHQIIFKLKNERIKEKN